MDSVLIEVTNGLPALSDLAKAECVELRAEQGPPERVAEVLAAMCKFAPKLKSLTLHSRLPILPDSLAELTSLQQLAIRDPELSGLPSTIGNLSRLRTLRLDTFLLGSLPKTISRLTKLRTLTIDSHHLIAVPKAVEGLQELTTVELMFRRVIVPDWEKPAYFAARFEQTLSDLFDILVALPKVETLALGEPPPDGWCPEPILDELPETLAQMPSLKTLKLVSCSYPLVLPLAALGRSSLRQIVHEGVSYLHPEDELRRLLPNVELSGNFFPDSQVSWLHERWPPRSP